MRKTKPYLTAKQAEDSYLLKQRQDEDPDFKRERVTYPEWKYANQELRDSWIADFEQAVYEKFGCFPKPNWMI